MVKNRGKSKEVPDWEKIVHDSVKEVTGGLFKSYEDLCKAVETKKLELNSYNRGISMEVLAERDWERKNGKVRTGDRRLDDLLLGGIPSGSNVAIYGPPFTGKEVTMNRFITDGLIKEIPAIYILTDCTVDDVRKEMGFMLRGGELKKYETNGLLHYIDAYSQSIGFQETCEQATLVEDSRNMFEIFEVVCPIADSMFHKHGTHRLVFRGISGLITEVGVDETQGFLKMFAKNQKNNNAVSMYSFEKGMHDDDEIEKILSVMNGCIEYKVEQLRTYLRVKEIGDVQSRAWIDYTHSRQGLYIGSFCLSDI